MTANPETFGNVHALEDDMPYDGNAIQHDNALDDMIAGASFTADAEPLPEGEGTYDEFLRAEQPQLEREDVDASMLEPRKRTPTARKYERKVAGVFSIAVKVTAAQQSTLADSAALLLHGPDISQKMGDLAADNARVARIIDMITDQTENPATAVIMASAPLILQLIRNHEPVVEKEHAKPARQWKIPLTKKVVRFRVGIKLGKRLKNMTNEPVALQRHVFSNPEIQAALKKQGINVVIN